MISMILKPSLLQHFKLTVNVDTPLVRDHGQPLDRFCCDFNICSTNGDTKSHKPNSTNNNSHLSVYRAFFELEGRV